MRELPRSLQLVGSWERDAEVLVSAVRGRVVAFPNVDVGRADRDREPIGKPEPLHLLPAEDPAVEVEDTVAVFVGEVLVGTLIAT